MFGSACARCYGMNGNYDGFGEIGLLLAVGRTARGASRVLLLLICLCLSSLGSEPAAIVRLPFAPEIYPEHATIDYFALAPKWEYVQADQTVYDLQGKLVGRFKMAYDD